MRFDAVRRLWERLRERGPGALEESAGYTTSEVRMGEILLPLIRDLSEANAAIADLSARARALEVALDHLPVAALVVDASGRPVARNGPAVRLLKGIEIPLAVVGSAWAGRDEKAGRLTLPGGLALRVVPGDTSGSTVAGPRLLFLVPADGSFELSTEHLQNRFGLTPAQGRVVALVAQGLTNKEIASRLGLSSETVHKHLMAIFPKCGVATRAGLVALAYGARFGIELSPSLSPADLTR